MGHDFALKTPHTQFLSTESFLKKLELRHWEIFGVYMKKLGCLLTMACELRE